jgi:glycosyltransferase involved in cell wall biosynthesis
MKSIHIGVDLTSIWRQPTGIFRYATELARHLLLLQDITIPIRYTLFFAREIHHDFLPYRDLFDACICPSRNELFIKQIWFPALLPFRHLDAIHYPAFPPPFIHPFGPAMIMTFHDAGPWRYPEALTSHGRIYFRTLLARGMHSCSSVITVSEHARSEIGYFLGERFLPKITVISEAARPAFSIPCSDAYRKEVRAKYALPERYFLAVTTIEPRKNLVTLLDAFKQLNIHSNMSCPPLVIVGRKGWNFDDILAYMGELEGKVVFPGHVSDDELVALYQMATCLVFPSLYEGFGLPVLEAMMAACPVITSSVSSLPEVAGDAALFVDPLNAEDITFAMQKILHDESLRSRLVREGFARAHTFTWETAAQRTQAVYLSVAQHNPRTTLSPT